MFTHLRQSAQGFFAKAVLFLLVGMFVLWGIGDVFRGMTGGPAYAAKVGGTTISVQKLRYEMQRNHADAGKALGRLVNQLLMEKEEAALGIVVSDDEVAQYVRALPEFKGQDGQFDKVLYQQYLAATGIDERSLIENLRSEIAAKLLVGAVAGGQIPEEIVMERYKLEQEQREAGIMFIPASSSLAQTKAPTEQEIKAYYDAHTKDFLAPEYRSLSYVVLPLLDVEAKIEVPEDEIRRTYGERKDDFFEPERRRVEQMLFKDEADAGEIADQLKQGADFDTLAKSADILNKGKVLVGDLSENELPKEAVNAGVFKLKAGETSAPVQSDFGWHIFHVSKIIPGGTLSFDEARGKIAKEIAAREAQDTIVRIMNGFEDTLAGGASLDKAAETIGRKVQTLGPVTRDGKGLNGAKMDLPSYDNFLTVAFATAEKDQSQAVQAKDGSYFIVRVDSVAPEHVRPLGQVKQQAEKAALAEKAQVALKKMADDLYGQLRSGKNVSIAPVDVGNFTRDTETVPEGTFKGKTVPHALVGELFRIAPHESTHPYPTEDGGYMIGVLAKITPAPEKASPKTLEGIRDELKTTLGDEVLQQYLNYLREKYSVTVNNAALGMKDEEKGDDSGL